LRIAHMKTFKDNVPALYQEMTEIKEVTAASCADRSAWILLRQDCAYPLIRG